MSTMSIYKVRRTAPTKTRHCNAVSCLKDEPVVPRTQMGLLPASVVVRRHWSRDTNRSLGTRGTNGSVNVGLDVLNLSSQRHCAAGEIVNLQSEMCRDVGLFSRRDVGVGCYTNAGWVSNIVHADELALDLIEFNQEFVEGCGDIVVSRGDAANVRVAVGTHWVRKFSQIGQVIDRC